jgi:DNA-binding transcriptional LysR family regulator
VYLEAIKIFCDVVRQRSFSQAAAANKISQSAASQNVLQLEKSLGVRLIDRSKRPLRLTPEGQVYYEGCTGLIEQYHAVEQEVKRLRNEVSGSLSVAAIYSVGLSGMSRHVERFGQRYPHAQIRLSYLHPDRVLEKVLRGEAELGLISYPKTGRDLVVLPWRTEPLVVACPPGHHLAGREQASGAELSGERFVAFDDALVIRKQIDRQLRQHQVEVEVVMAFDNIETIKRAVELGEGVAILPEPSFRNEVLAGTLVAVPLVQPVLERPLGIIRRRSRELSRAAQRFIDLIQQDSSEGDGFHASKVSPPATHARAAMAEPAGGNGESAASGTAAASRR